LNLGVGRIGLLIFLSLAGPCWSRADDTQNQIDTALSSTAVNSFSVTPATGNASVRPTGNVDTPEPTSLALLAAGGAVAGYLAKRRKQQG
jgi:hypothetical protein